MKPTIEHIKLLRRSNIELNQKRPFGNSNYFEDMVEILGYDWKKDEDGQYTEEQYKKLDKLLKELPEVWWKVSKNIDLLTN